MTRQDRWAFHATTKDAASAAAISTVNAAIAAGKDSTITPPAKVPIPNPKIPTDPFPP